MRRIAVIGLGRFGMALSRELASSGAQVLAIDRSANLVNELKDDVDVAVRLDSTDETALASQEIARFDVCVVAIGENFEAALLTAVILGRLNVPRVICRAQTEFHAEIFRQIGAHEVIQPETQSGGDLARKLANPHLEDFISLADGFTLIELRAPKEFHGQTLLTLGLRTTYHVNLVAIKRPVPTGDSEEQAEREIVSVPNPDNVIQPNDILVVVGSDDALARLPKE